MYLCPSPPPPPPPPPPIEVSDEKILALGKCIVWATIKASVPYFLFFQEMIALQKLGKMLFISSKKLFLLSRYSNFCISSTANKYYSSAGHHEQKNKKTIGQVIFSAATIKQRIKLLFL